jgi:hypothetical protein
VPKPSMTAFKLLMLVPLGFDQIRTRTVFLNDLLEPATNYRKVFDCNKRIEHRLLRACRRYSRNFRLLAQIDAGKILTMFENPASLAVGNKRNQRGWIYPHSEPLVRVTSRWRSVWKRSFRSTSGLISRHLYQPVLQSIVR